MMKNKAFFLFSVIFCISQSLQAADTISGSPIYATGNFGDPTWSPGIGVGPSGSPEDFRLFDDGATNGDEVADDGIWTCVVEDFFIPIQDFEWKIASPGWAPVNAPDSSTTNLFNYADGDGRVVFIFDTNPQNDGLRPDVGLPNQFGFAYSGTLWDGLQPVSSVSLAGDFQTLLGGAENWIGTDPSSQIILVDDGTGVDETAGDGLFTGSVSGLPVGSYEYKGVLNFEDFTTAKYGALGFSTAGANLRFNVLEESETVVFVFDSIRSRLGQSTGGSLEGPPFFAQSSAWGEGFTAVEDLGAAENNVFRKVFTVPEPGTHSFRIRDLTLREFPLSGDYPFVTTSPNQEVLVIFDRNQYSDPYFPQTNLVFAVDAESLNGLNDWEYVQPVGDWMVDFGGAADWMAEDLNFEAFDEGDPRDNDAVAGDGIFAIQVETAVTANNKSMKAIANRVGLEEGPWDIQLGGPGEGITLLTTNTNIPFSYTPGLHTFQIDTLTGRVGVSDTPPQRPPLSAPVSINDWELH